MNQQSNHYMLGGGGGGVTGNTTYLGQTNELSVSLFCILYKP